MSNTQKAMNLLITTFHNYSGKEGDPLTLSKNELQELLKAEFGDVLGKTNDKALVDKIFKDLDADGDNTVDFKEFISFVAVLTMICNEFFTKKK